MEKLIDVRQHGSLQIAFSTNIRFYTVHSGCDLALQPWTYCLDSEMARSGCTENGVMTQESHTP